MVYPMPILRGWGHVGIVYDISDQIVVKRRVFCDDEEAFLNEVRIFDLLESNPQCSSLVRSYYRTSSANFMELVGDSLETRLQRHQKRDPKTRRVIGLRYREPRQLIIRWMIQLTSAVAALEALGFVHADLRPPNILLDSTDRLKLIDFDGSTTVGTPVRGAQPPYARVLGTEGGADHGSFGSYGPRTDQFALGGVFYYMTRGFEPYDDEWFGHDHGPIIVDLLQQMKFPEMGDDQIDVIIRKCWYGEYTSIQALALDVRCLSRDHVDSAGTMKHEDYEWRRRKCEKLVKEGILDLAPRSL